MVKPLVSYVVPFRNACSGCRREAWLRECVDSIMRQTEEDIEGLFIDDGSSDQSREVVAEMTKHDPRMKLLGYTGCDHKGLAWALNEGLRVSLGEFIAHLDSDDKSELNRTAIQVAFMRKHDDVAIIGSGMNVIDLMAGTKSQRPPKALDDAGLRAVAEGGSCPFYHSTVMFRRSVYEAVGGYPDSYDYCEDYAYWVRILRCFRGACTPEYLATYRRHYDCSVVRHFAAQCRSSRRVAREAEGLATAAGSVDKRARVGTDGDGR